MFNYQIINLYQLDKVWSDALKILQHQVSSKTLMTTNDIIATASAFSVNSLSLV